MKNNYYENDMKINIIYENRHSKERLAELKYELKKKEIKSTKHTNALVEFHADDGVLVSFIMPSTVSKFSYPATSATIGSPSVH